MYKIICDVTTLRLDEVANLMPKGNYAPAAKKYNKVIKYKDCKPCDVEHVKLTSTSKNTPKEVEMFNAAWSQNVLSPINPNYYEAYESILDVGASKAFNLSNFKFIGLIESDPGLAINYAGLTSVYEMIIDVTNPQKPFTLNLEGYEAGYKKYHSKAVYIDITNATHNTFLSFGAFDAAFKPGYFVISHPLVAYSLRYKGTLDCPAISHKANIGDGYFVYGDQIYSRHGHEFIKFMERDLIERIEAQLETYRYCVVNNKVVTLIDTNQGADPLSIDDTCALMGGKLNSMQDALKYICSKKGADFELGNNKIASIKCDNYQSYLEFDENGEIVNAPLVSREFEQQYPSFHNEL